MERKEEEKKVEMERVNEERKRDKEERDKNKEKETKMLEREETILRSQHQASQVKFVSEATRKTIQCLSSNNSYKPGENAFEKIKNCELEALKNQEETFRMFNCIRQIKSDIDEFKDDEIEEEKYKISFI
ncbi:hypothetical protein ACTA71_011311 [Dictyostelium dimigraforme]